MDGFLQRKDCTSDFMRKEVVQHDKENHNPNQGNLDHHLPLWPTFRSEKRSVLSVCVWQYLPLLKAKAIINTSFSRPSL